MKNMEKKALKQEIDVLIESIKKQADRMNAQDNLSMVELEVLHHKIQKLYEKSILIHHLPPSEEKKKEFTIQQQPAEEKIIPAVQQPDAVIHPPVQKNSEEEKKQTDVKQTTDLFGETATGRSKVSFKTPAEKDRQPKAIRKPIPDLKAAISINDKFRFINDLFHGNATEFNIALNQINSCQGSEDAETYVSNIRDIYQWKDESESVEIFLELVERRFL
jgi:hypothetical protein